MRERFLNWLNSVAALQAMVIVALCVLVAGAFSLGIIVAQARRTSPRLPVQTQPNYSNAAPLPQRGTYGAIDQIEGNTIRLRDPRSGHVWSVRANKQTIIRFGERRQIPLQALRPGQRVFIVGAPDANEFDATFIGVVVGQGQRYVLPPMPMCVACVE